MAKSSIPTRLPASFLSYADHSNQSITPAVPVRALKRLARCLPSNTLHNAALDTINLAGDLVAGNRMLRDEQAYQRWRQDRIKELLHAMDQVLSPLLPRSTNLRPGWRHSPKHSRQILLILGVVSVLVTWALLILSVGCHVGRLREMHHRAGCSART